MDCKSCKWLKIYDYKFPDDTKTIGCEKYNKHLGFTNKKGQVKNVKPINECELNRTTINEMTGIEEDDDSTGRVILFKGRWAVEVDEAEKRNIIFTSKDKAEAIEKLAMFKSKRSWIKGISYTKRYKKWIAKIYLEKFKYKQIGTFKTFYEAKKALKEANNYLKEKN